jgi:hypothetical protein
LARASSWDWSSWLRCEHLAYAMRMSALGVSGSVGAGAGCRAATTAPVPGRPSRHPQELGEPGHLRDAAGVVGAGDRAGA